MVFDGVKDLEDEKQSEYAAEFDSLVVFYDERWIGRR
jgi:hypothetical protein